MAIIAQLARWFGFGDIAKPFSGTPSPYFRTTAPDESSWCHVGLHRDPHRFYRCYVRGADAGVLGPSACVKP